MTFIIQLIIGIVILIALVYFIISYFYTDQGISNILKTITPLNKRKDIVMSDITQSTLLGSGGSTVMGFFKLNAGNRTLNYDNTFKPLMYIDNNWYLEISPSPVKDITARLRVQTNKGGVLHYEEIELPSIPKQKWIFIAILRDGRRFDVIYDNKLVASKRLSNYPVVISSPLSVGNVGFDGSVIHVVINAKRMAPIEVERERVAHVDTNNTVIEDNSINLSFPLLNLFAQCPSGLPCDPVTKPPSNNLYSWKTPYA